MILNGLRDDDRRRGSVEVKISILVFFNELSNVRILQWCFYWLHLTAIIKLTAINQVLVIINNFCSVVKEIVFKIKKIFVMINGPAHDLRIKR